MSNQIISDKISNINEYLKKIKTYYNNKKFNEKDNVFFFRGHEKASYTLLPSVLRDKKFSERGILLNYRDHLPRNVNNTRFDFVKDRIEILAEMQHYTIPTRLLDWTMSPLIALFFAVRSAKESCCTTNEEKECEDSAVWVFDPWEHYSLMRKKREEDSAVWVFDPWEYYSLMRKKREANKTIFNNWFNMMKLGRALLSDRNFFQIDDDLKAIFNSQNSISECELCDPIGLIAPYQNNRMIHQAAAFTIHGNNKKPLEEISNTKNFLKKIIIPCKDRYDILNELEMLFINEYTVFPDFVGMSNQINNKGSLYHYSPMKNINPCPKKTKKSKTHTNPSK